MPKGGKGRLSEDSSASDHTLPDVPDNPEDEQSTSVAGRRTHCKRGLKESPPRKESPDEASDAVASLVAGTDIIRIQDFEMSALIFPSAFQVRLDDTDTICVESLVHLESFCLQDDTDTPLDLSFDWNTDMHFGELMANPTLVCPRVPVALGVSLYPVTSLLQAFYYSFKNRLKGMAGGFNTDIQWEGIPTIPILADYFTKVGAYARTMIFPPLEKIQLTQQEYVIFKNIVIFTSVVGLSDEGADIIRRGRHRYEAKLLQSIAQRVAPLIGKCCTMNTGGLMASRLAVDVFFQ
ncbi:unnamed protein product, partial [Mesorhabditis spiculigera]